MATSRGRGLNNFFNEDPTIELHIHPGKTLAFLTHKALQHIQRHKSTTEGTKNHIYVYFLAGITDITYRDYIPTHTTDKGIIHTYEEVIHINTPDETTTRTINIFKNTAHQIADAGATPCFSTVVPCSLSTWNHLRLKQGKTTHLLHHRHYDDMQVNLQKAIVNINHYIQDLNTQYNMQTPKIAKCIKKNQQSPPTQIFL